MKKLNKLKIALFLGLSFWGLKATAQTQEWGQVGTSFQMSVNDGFPSDYCVKGKSDYFVQDSLGYLRVFLLTDNAGFKKMLPSLNTGAIGNELNTDVVGSNIYILKNVAGVMKSYVYNTLNNTLNVINFPYVLTGLQSNWETKTTNDKLFLSTLSNSTTINLMELDLTTNTWLSNINVTSKLNISTQDLTAIPVKLTMYTSATDIYTGISGPVGSVRSLGKASLSNLAGFDFYNTAGANNGRIYYAGGETNSGAYFLSGDGIDAPRLVFYDPSSLTSYEKIVGANNCDIQTVSDPTLPVNITFSDYDVISIPNVGTAVVSKISNPGVINFNRLAVLLRDDNTNTWDSVATSIPYFQTFEEQTLSLSVDETNNHFFVKSETTFNNTRIEVSNRKVVIDVPSITLNTGNCVNVLNQMYSNITIRDYDGDKIGNGIAATFPSLPDKHYRLISADSTSIPSEYHYALYGTPTVVSSYNINIAFTDKYNSNFVIAPPVNVVAGILPVQFNLTNNVFCDNIEEVDLASLVNPYNLGVFSVNGDELVGTIMHIPDYIASGDINGTLNYKTFVNGCLVDASATYTIPTTGTITVTSTTIACGASDGTATMTFIPGTSPMNTFEWSTGENTTTVSDLTPGPYYCEVVDNLGCKKRENFTIDPNGITVAGSETNVTCFGANNGSIDLTVTGITSPSVLWSTGETTEDISNLGAGTYSVTISNATGCQIIRNFEITEPNALLLFTTPVKPTCGNSNGQIMANVAGGVTPYSFAWSSGQTVSPLNNIPSGSYTVIVTDANGCTLQRTIDLSDQGAPIVTATTHNSDCGESNGAIGILATADPATFLSATDYLWSNGDITTNPLALSAGEYTVKVKSAANGSGFNCYTYKTFTIENNGPKLQDICVVTVDTATSTNILVWQKVDTAGISHYNIYRETANSGQFFLIDTVHFTNLSEYHDLVANAYSGSWRYRIASVNECGVEGPLSPTHKTLVLHGHISTTAGTHNVYWDDYEGTSNVQEYIVWRHTNTGGWNQLAPTVPIGVSVFQDNLPVDTTGLDYFVETLLAAPCTSAKSRNFNSTRSNRDKGAFSIIEGNTNNIQTINFENLQVYPNPTTGELIVSSNEIFNANLTIFDIRGAIVFATKILTNNSTNIQLSELNAGYYFMRIAKDGKSETVKIIKQ